MFSAISPVVQKPSPRTKIRRLQLTKEEFQASIPQSACPKRCAISRQKRLENAASTSSRIDSPTIQPPNSSAKIHRPRLSGEEFRASIPQSTRPKRFEILSRKKLEKIVSTNDTLLDSPRENLGEVDDQLQYGHQPQSFDSSPVLGGYGDEHLQFSMKRFLDDRNHGVIGLKEYPDPELSLPVDAKMNYSSIETPLAPTYIIPRLAQSKGRPDIYDLPQGDSEPQADQEQARLEEQDIAAHFGTQIDNKNSIEHECPISDGLQLQNAELDEHESQRLEIDHSCPRREVSVSNVESQHGLACLRDATDRGGFNSLSLQESLDDLDQELLGLNPMKRRSSSPSESAPSTSKRPRINIDHQAANHFGFQYPVSDGNGADDENWDESPKRKPRKRRNHKTEVRNISLQELTVRRASIPREKEYQNEGKKAIRKRLAELPRRLPDMKSELVLVPDILDDTDFEDLIDRAVELSDDPIAPDGEVSEVEKVLRHSMKTLKLKPSNLTNKRFQMPYDIAGWKPKSLPNLRSSKTHLENLISYRDGFEGKEAVPIGRFMPVRTQGKLREREHRTISCFPPLVLVAEKSSLVQKLPKTKSKLFSFADSPSDRECFHTKDEEMPMLMEDQLVEQLIVQPQSSASSENINGRILPLQTTLTTSTAPEPMLSNSTRSQSQMTLSSPLEGKYSKMHYCHSGSSHLIITKPKTAGLPVGLRLHPDEAVRLARQFELTLIRRSTPKDLKPTLNDLQVSQELMTVSIKRAVSQIQSENTDSENEDDDDDDDGLGKSDEESESENDTSVQEELVSDELLEACLPKLEKEVSEPAVRKKPKKNAATETPRIEIGSGGSDCEYDPESSPQKDGATETDQDPDVETEDEEIVHDDKETQIPEKEVQDEEKLISAQKEVSPTSHFGQAPVSSGQLWGCIKSFAVTQSPLQHNGPLISIHKNSNQNLTQKINPDNSWRPQIPRSSGILMEVDEEIEDCSSPIQARLRVRGNHQRVAAGGREPRTYSQPLNVAPSFPDNSSNGTLEPQLKFSRSLLSHPNIQAEHGDSQGSTILGSPSQYSTNPYHIIRRLPPNDSTETRVVDEPEVPETQVLYMPEVSYFGQASQALAKPNYSRTISMPANLEQRLVAGPVLVAGDIGLAQAFKHKLGSMSPTKTPKHLPNLLDGQMSKGKSLKALTRQASQGMGALPPSAKMVKRQRMMSLGLPPPFLKPVSSSGA